MIFIPQIKKDDDLYGIIFLSQWLYKSKYLRLISYCYPFISVGYLCLFLQYVITQWKNVISLDILIAVFCLETMVLGLSNLDQEKSIVEINQLRVQYFWDNNFFNNREKCEFDRIVKISVYLHYVLWFMLILAVTVLCTAPYFPQTVYNKDWTFLTKLVVRMCVYLYYLFGYYEGMIHVSFYSYTILHSCLQVKTLRAYLRYEFRRYEKIDPNKKIYSYRYQALIEGAFLRCIKQHKRIVTYGAKIIGIYNRCMGFHFLFGATLFSLMLYCCIFDPLSCEIALIICTFQLVLGVSYYPILGDLFSEMYEDYHSELLKVKWYSLNKTNRQVYFMFLMFTQKKYKIELWPSMPMSRSFMCKFVKWIYTGVTVLTSVKNN